MQVAEQSLRGSWSVQKRVIGALLAREIITRYGRHNIGFLWLFVEPMIFTMGVTLLWTAMRNVHGSTLPIVAFGVTGYSTVLLWRGMPGRCIKAVEPNLALMYHRNVRMMDIYAARLLLEAGGATISFIALCMVLVATGWIRPPEDVLTIAIAWGLLAWFGAALAVLLGALSEESDLVVRLWTPVSYLTFPLSGAAFIVDALPKGAQDAILLVPMVHAAEMVREGYFGSSVRSHYDVGYLAAWCLGLSFVAVFKARATAAGVKPE